MKFARVMLMVALAATSGYAADRQQTSFFSQDWLDTVISVEVATPNEAPRAIGTGFLIRTPSNHMVLVTAKHLIFENTTLTSNLAYRLNNRVGDSTLVTDEQAADATQSSWFSSPDADVACRFVTTLSCGETSVVRTLPLSRFLEAEHVQAAAPILVVGFPTENLRSTQHATPIVRNGIVARNDHADILVDAKAWPGDSGGPVVYAPSFPVDQQTLKSPVLQGQWIVGLVSSPVSVSDVAVSAKTKKPRFSIEENSGLVSIVSADKILELLNRQDVLATDAKLDR